MNEARKCPENFVQNFAQFFAQDFAWSKKFVAAISLWGMSGVKFTEINGGARHKAGDKTCFHHLTQKNASEPDLTRQELLAPVPSGTEGKGQEAQERQPRLRCEHLSVVIEADGSGKLVTWLAHVEP